MKIEPFVAHHSNGHANLWTQINLEYQKYEIVLKYSDHQIKEKIWWLNKLLGLIFYASFKALTLSKEKWIHTVESNNCHTHSDLKLLC